MSRKPPAQKLCIKEGCSNVAKNGNYCWTCTKRRYRERNPSKKRFNIVRDRAKRKGQEFTIDWLEFSRVAERDGFVGQPDMHFDRIDPLKGYVDGNVRFVKSGVNLKKSYSDKVAHERFRQESAGQSSIEPGDLDDLPF